MSRIFDALQRSEADRSKAESSTSPGATELLRRAERQAALKWQGDFLVEQESPAEIEAPSLPTSHQAASTVSRTMELTALVEPSERDAKPDPLGFFQAERISIPTRRGPVSITDSESAVAEAFRLLGVRLRHSRRNRPLQKVLITSTIPNEGKSTVSANLACVLSLRSAQRIVLLEGDLRRPSLSPMFGLEKQTGICEWLQDDRDLKESIYYLQEPGIWFMPAGSATRNPLELLQSGKLTKLMDQLTSWFDWIVIDSPPVLPLGDTSVWTRLADGILLVSRQGITRKQQLQRGIEALDPKKIIGAVLNGSRSPENTNYYYRFPVAPGTTDSSTNRAQ